MKRLSISNASRLGLWALVVITFLSSCKRDPNSIIGGDLQPGSEYLYAQFSDSLGALTVVAYTKADDSVVTSGTQYQTLGSMSTQNFGTQNKSMVVQFAPATAKDTVYSHYIIDSVVLRMRYHTLYPSASARPAESMSIQVYELADYEPYDTSFSKRYFSCTPVNHQGSPLGQRFTFVPNLTDSVWNEKDSVMVHEPSIRVPLNKSFGEKIFNINSRVNTAEDFLKEMYGLYIMPDIMSQSGSGNFVTFDLSNDPSGLYVYYRMSESDTVSKIKSYVIFGRGLMTYTHIENDFSRAHPDYQAQLSGDTIAGRNRLFIQSGAGSVVKVRFPRIRELNDLMANNRIVINQATLVFDVADDLAVNTPPSTLTVAQISQDTITNIIDYINSGYVGGTYSADKKHYRMVVTRHLTKILTDSLRENPELTILPNHRGYGSQRVMLYGSDGILNGSKRARLELIYTVLPFKN